MYINSERNDIDLQRAIKRYIRGEIDDRSRSSSFVAIT